jgi:hypothetical protein
MNVLICISSKYPNPFLYECIRHLYEKQINSQSTKKYTYKIQVIDSCSDNLVYYNKISQDFPDIEIHMIENKNYEYGAWKYILDTDKSSDIFFCIQDSMIINNFIDLDILDNKTVYSFHHHSGYNLHKSIKELGIENLKNSNLNYTPIIDTDFNLAQHCSFIVNKQIFQDIFRHLTVPPIDKNGACSYERNFGIYFLDKGINTVNLYNFIFKIHGGRN